MAILIACGNVRRNLGRAAQLGLHNKRKLSVFEIFLAGGILMWPILACSLIVIAISAERYWTLNPAKIAPKTLLAQVWSWIKNNQLDATKLRELKQSSPLGQILAAGLSNS
ncbi:MAG: MotA/TolQ/ExbB proton channel family protein, partial [Cellvibrio sp.]|nr:MotA/TolQ/ExbB proton channel family protein [Cellvibrio sp.]